jgi:hypothetical protein
MECFIVFVTAKERANECKHAAREPFRWAVVGEDTGHGINTILKFV